MNDKERNQKLAELDIEKRELEINKLKQEQEKIELEVKELKKSSFKKTNWWSIIIPLSFSIIPVVYLLFSGIFDSKYQEYKASKASLEYDQKKFTEIRTDIEKRITVIKDSVRIVEGLFKIKQDSLQSVKILVIQKQDSLNKLSLDISFSKRNIAELEKTKTLLLSDIKAKDKTLGDIVQQKQVQEKILNDSISNLNRKNDILYTGFNQTKVSSERFQVTYKTEVALLNDKINSYKYQIELNNDKIKKLETEINELKKPVYYFYENKRRNK